MNDTDFDLLCKGLSADEARLFRKILKDWCNGDEESFPVQLALLTRAQWRAAAQMPLTLQKTITMFETRLASHQKEMAVLVKSIGYAGDDKIRAFEKTVTIHTEAMERVADQGSGHLDETEKFAREIRAQMEYGLRESGRITKSFIDERHRLEEAQRDYKRSIEWREAGLQMLAWFIAVVIGFITGWYYFAHPR